MNPGNWFPTTRSDLLNNRHGDKTDDATISHCQGCAEPLDLDEVIEPHTPEGCYPNLAFCAFCMERWVHGPVGPDGRTRVGGMGTCPNCRAIMVDDDMGDVPEDGDQEALPSPLPGQEHVAGDDGDESDDSEGVYRIAEALAVRIEGWMATHAPPGTTRINPIVID